MTIRIQCENCGEWNNLTEKIKKLLRKIQTEKLTFKTDNELIKTLNHKCTNCRIEMN